MVDGVGGESERCVQIGKYFTSVWPQSIQEMGDDFCFVLNHDQ